MYTESLMTSFWRLRLIPHHQSLSVLLEYLIPFRRFAHHPSLCIDYRLFPLCALMAIFLLHSPSLCCKSTCAVRHFLLFINPWPLANHWWPLYTEWINGLRLPDLRHRLSLRWLPSLGEGGGLSLPIFQSDLRRVIGNYR